MKISEYLFSELQTNASNVDLDDFILEINRYALSDNYTTRFVFNLLTELKDNMKADDTYFLTDFLNYLYHISKQNSLSKITSIWQFIGSVTFEYHTMSDTQLGIGSEQERTVIKYSGKGFSLFYSYKKYAGQQDGLQVWHEDQKEFYNSEDYFAKTQDELDSDLGEFLLYWNKGKINGKLRIDLDYTIIRHNKFAN
ncbi:MAG: hypothetical protein IPO24_18885 [Bacteroidetes bacterium]|nr:hypothetical protein [Bacteroidota bacterium]